MPAANQALASLLHEMSQMLDLLGEDSFRASSHARAARAIEDLPHDIASMDRKQLLEVQGIGPKMADKILEFAATGEVKEHKELASRVPPGLLMLLQIPGLGPKIVRAMWTQCSICDIPSLKKCIDDGTILGVPRMGQKQVNKIKAAIALAEQGQQRLWLGRAYALAERFASRLRELPMVERVEPAGSLRRGRDTVGDIDILVAIRPGHDHEAAQIGEAFRTTPGVTQVLVAGDNKSSVRASLNFDVGRWKRTVDEGEQGPTIQVDLRVLPLASWGAALMYFTGSKEHNVRLRERALKMGMTLNEWGLFPEDDEKTPPQARGVKPVAAATEEEVYAALKLPYIPPECREDRGECDCNTPIRLVEVADIKAELHAHTTASDGQLSIEELAEAAKARGYHTIAVTDHSRSSAVAGGLTVERLLTHINAVRSAKVKGITILAGSEVDILADGTLDYPDDILKQLDIVVASPHAGLTQDPPTATARMLKAIGNPYVHIVGHPTGRLINRRAGLSPDLAAIIKAAQEHDVALEINSHWMRLDLRDSHVREAVKAGCKIAIDCDVHARDEFDNIRFGVATGRRGWLTPELCINTWDAERLHGWLKSKGGR
ncbi:MAG TPA: DNA polymerase/3'-5' exonuclease PolX [Phycisphaerales bacterium]|nr:DNA polymerase/3'-5' exonuclease PolX [Phycisphaerales bacterium]